MEALSESPGLSWPRQPARKYLYYPYLVFLNNTSGSQIELDGDSRIALTDGNELYAPSHLSGNYTLAAGSTTKLEFSPADFTSVPTGTYQMLLTLIGPSFSQTVEFSASPVTVVEEASHGLTMTGSLGWGTDHVIPPPQDLGNFSAYGTVSDQLGALTFTVPTDSSGPGGDIAPVLVDIDADVDLDLFLGGDGRNINLYTNE